MIPELGKYATEVLSAYAISLVLIAALVALSVRRGKKAQAELKVAERESKGVA